MSVIVSLDDTIAVFLHAEGSVDLTGVVRLSYAGAVLLFGFVADIKKRAYLPFMAACVLAGSTLMFAFLDSPETYSINAVLLYILSASSVVYLTVAFLDLAPRTAHPEAPGRAWGASCAPSPSRRRRCPSSGFTTRRGTR